MPTTPPATARTGLLVLGAALAFGALTTLSACPKGNNGTGGGSGGGDVGGGAGGGTGGGDDSGTDAGPADAGTCARFVIGPVDLSGYPVVKLATGGSGTFWAALGAGGLDVVRYSGGNFETPAHVTGGGTLLEHALAAGDADAVLAWTQSAGSGGELHYAHFDGTQWTTATPTTRATTPQYPQLANAGARAFLLWSEGPQQSAQLEFQRYSVGAWSVPARLDVGDGGASIAAATADQTGPVAFWGAPTADAGFRLWVGDLGAAGAPATADTTHGGYALLAAGNHAGQAMALVQQGDSSVLARRWVRASGFAEESQPTMNGTNALLSLALLDDGSAYATWTDALNHASGAAMTSTTVGWIPFQVPDEVSALTATNGTQLALVSLGNNKLHFEWHGAAGWSDPLELPTGIDATQLDGLAVTASGELALDVVGTADGGASTQYAVVCH